MTQMHVKFVFSAVRSREKKERGEVEKAAA
jgi:hypothetical protein